MMLWLCYKYCTSWDTFSFITVVYRTKYHHKGKPCHPLRLPVGHSKSGDITSADQCFWLCVTTNTYSADNSSHMNQRLWSMLAGSHEARRRSRSSISEAIKDSAAMWHRATWGTFQKQTGRVTAASSQDVYWGGKAGNWMRPLFEWGVGLMRPSLKHVFISAEYVTIKLIVNTAHA